MPVYEYRCKACGRTFEIEHGFHDERPTTCKECGGQLVRVFHPVGVVFKGSGFHKTDYTSSGVRKDAAKTDAKTADGAAASKAAESKPPGTSSPSTSASKPSESSKPK
jgi:putative FmdB family regulatory protein